MTKLMRRMSIQSSRDIENDYNNNYNYYYGRLRYTCMVLISVLIVSVVSLTASEQVRVSRSYTDVRVGCTNKYHDDLLEDDVGADDNFFVNWSSDNNNHIDKKESDGTSFLEGVGYMKLRAAVIERYRASDPETDDIDEQFDDALWAMYYVEQDGRPVPIQGVDGLFVGSIGAAYNLHGLQEAGITHVLSLERTAPCKFPDSFACLHIDTIWDNSDAANNISQYFDRTLPFIDDALKAGGSVLVHCYRGKSRSVSTIIAYLIQTKGWTPEYALEEIHRTRSIADPNDGYWEELHGFYNTTVLSQPQQSH